MGRNVIPPSLDRPGPSVTIGYPPMLAAYPQSRCSRVRDDRSRQVRTCLGRLPSSLCRHVIKTSSPFETKLTTLRLTRSAVTCHRFLCLLFLSPAPSPTAPRLSRRTPTQPPRESDDESSHSKDTRLPYRTRRQTHSQFRRTGLNSPKRGSR